MHHTDGFDVRLRHGDLYYDEDPKFTQSDGRLGFLNSCDSAVAIARTLGADEDEPFTFELTLKRGFQWHTASIIRVVVHIGIHGQENRVLKFYISADKTNRSNRMVMCDNMIEKSCGLLPVPQVDDPQSIRVRRVSQGADPGSVLVYVTRGHDYKAATQGHSGLNSAMSQHSRDPSDVAFEPLHSRNGTSARFEFVVRSKGREVPATIRAETEGGRHLSTDNLIPTEDQVDGTQQQERPIKKRLGGTSRRHAQEAHKQSFLGHRVEDAPSCHVMGKIGGYAVHDLLQNVGSANNVPDPIEASRTQHTSTAAQILETNETVSPATRPEVETPAPPFSPISPRRHSQQAPSQAPTVYERRVKSESAALVPSRPRTQPGRTLIDLTSDNEEPVAVKKEPKEKARTHPVPRVEDDGDEVAELKHQLAALEYERRKTRLDAEKQQQELELKHKSEESELKHTWEEAELNRRLVKAVEREKKKQRVAAAQEG
ncbi:hypothetical protein LTS09_011389 [Friedmanniomyces endolithicus]|nr:hypothetical protein LTS09_011389 [Friedmanniomyces endolithicus]